MPRFSGPQRKGAAQDARAIRRAEAEARNALTPTERTRAHRRNAPAMGLTIGELVGLVHLDTPKEV